MPVAASRKARRLCPEHWVDAQVPGGQGAAAVPGAGGRLPLRLDRQRHLPPALVLCLRLCSGVSSSVIVSLCGGRICKQCLGATILTRPGPQCALPRSFCWPHAVMDAQGQHYTFIQKQECEQSLPSGMQPSLMYPPPRNLFCSSVHGDAGTFWRETALHCKGGTPARCQGAQRRNWSC